MLSGGSPPGVKEGHLLCHAGDRRRARGTRCDCVELEKSARPQARRCSGAVLSHRV